MSNIYDLFMRAGQAKAAGNVAVASADVSPGNAQKIPRGGSAPSVSGDGATTVRPHAGDCADSPGVRNGFVKPYSQTSWSPDRATMLRPDDGSYYFTAGEEFRTLRSNLSLVRERVPLQKLLVTSPLPREGKTFIAATLALVVSWQDKDRVLLIDGDLRWSRLHVFLGAPAAPGLSDYLKGEADESAIIRRSPVSNNLFFVPGGKAVPNAGELIGNGRLRVLLEHSAPAFDWIIIDSPPAVPISDAKLIARVCDGVLMVVRAGATPLDLARRLYTEFRDHRFVGVILNGADRTPSHKYYYDYGYYGKQKPPSS